MKTDALQTALYLRLTTDAALIAALSNAWGAGIVPVFSDVPEIHGEDDAFFPYISFGPDVASPWDTKTDLGASVSVQIDVWSRQAGFIEVKNILSLIHARLHYQPLTIAGAHQVYTRVDSSTTSRDPDGRTRRGLMLLTVVYDDI
jgi:hypothetical protein